MLCCLERFYFSDSLNYIEYLFAGGHKDEVVVASYFPISFLPWVFSACRLSLYSHTLTLCTSAALCNTLLLLNCSSAPTAKFWLSFSELLASSSRATKGLQGLQGRISDPEASLCLIPCREWHFSVEFHSAEREQRYRAGQQPCCCSRPDFSLSDISGEWTKALCSPWWMSLPLDEQGLCISQSHKKDPQLHSGKKEQLWQA